MCFLEKTETQKIKENTEKISKKRKINTSTLNFAKEKTKTKKNPQTTM